MKKKFQFALVDTTTYTGKDALDFYSKALLQGQTKSTFKTVPNVKSKIKLPRYDAGDIIRPAGCDWNPGGEGTLSQKEFDVCSFDIQLQLCTSSIETSFLSEQLRAGHNTGEVAPSIFTDYMLNQVQKKIQNDLEDLVINGDASTGGTYPTNICDGLLKKFDEDENVIHVTGDTAITQTNVIAEIKKVYDQIPATVLNSPDLKIYVSDHIMRNYFTATAAQSNEAYFQGEKQPNFLGIPLHWTPKAPPHRMFAADSQNIILLTDLLNDEEELRVIPMLDTFGIRQLRVSGGFKFGVDYLVSEEVVSYSPAGV